jgi:hypothetical protein
MPPKNKIKKPYYRQQSTIFDEGNGQEYPGPEVIEEKKQEISPERELGIKCKMCFNVLTSKGDRIPLMLLCGHTICKTCA